MKKLLIFLLAAASLMAAGAGDPLRATLLMDRLEIQSSDGNPAVWDASAYIGKDYDKLYFYSEGSRTSDESESENELLYSRAVTPFWDLQAGIEYDRAGSENRTWGVVAVQGLAPYFIDTRMRLKIGDGAVGANLDFEYEALITQRLILTPRMEIEAYSKEVPELQKGGGISSAAVGLRLRYEIRREFAPYIGVTYSNSFGKTASKYGGAEDTAFVAGLRFWF